MQSYHIFEDAKYETSGFQNLQVWWGFPVCSLNLNITQNTLINNEKKQLAFFRLLRYPWLPEGADRCNPHVAFHCLITLACQHWMMAEFHREIMMKLSMSSIGQAFATAIDSLAVVDQSSSSKSNASAHISVDICFYRRRRSRPSISNASNFLIDS